MAGTIANLLVDIVIVIMLGITICYCWILNRRIKVLQDSKSELAQLLKYFDESTQRASESIIALQTASKKIGENIQMRIDKANYLVDDLAFMIEKGNKVANQIEASFAVQRARNRIVASVAPEPAEEPEEDAPPVMEKHAAPQDKTHREKTVASLEAVLDRVTTRGKSVPFVEEKPAARQNQNGGRQARSRSEQELLDLLKAGLKG